MALVCKTEIKGKRNIRDYISDATGNVSHLVGKDVSRYLTGFANVYARLDEPTKDGLERLYQFKNSSTMKMDDLISTLTNGAVKNVEEFNKITSPVIASRIVDKVRILTDEIIRMSNNPSELREYALVDEYRTMLKASQWANSINMFTTKFFSAKWIPGIAESFDGLILSRDQVFKQNMLVDHFRSGSSTSSKLVEARGTKLKIKFNAMLNNTNAIKDGLGVEQISSLMKYFDQDENKTNNGGLKNRLQKMIDNGELERRDVESEADAVNRYTGHMQNVYKDWKIFNYGSEDIRPLSYYKDWEKYQDSYLYHIISSGSDYVRQIKDGFDKDLLNKEFVTHMSDIEKQIVSLFGKYVFKDDMNAINDFVSKTGIPVTDEGSFKIMKDYVPYLMNSGTTELFKSARLGGNTFADMLAQRRDSIANEDNSESGLVKNFISDLESYRAMMTQANEKLFGRQINHLFGHNVAFGTWANNNKFAANQMKIYASHVLKYDGSGKGAIGNSTRTVELFRQTALSLLGLQSAVTLMMSGPKNLLQGWSTMAMNIELGEINAKAFGKLSIKEALNSSTEIDGTTLAQIASSVDTIAKNMITGRRQEITIHDNDGTGMEGKYSGFLQGVFNFVETSNQYGLLAPFKSVISKKWTSAHSAMDSIRDATPALNNAGSEMMLRSWRKHEVFNMVSFEFHLDQEILKSNASNDIKKQVKNKWSKTGYEDTIRNIMQKNQYELYTKDNAYFGDFGADTKPFWTKVMLQEGDTIPKVMLGFMAASWYTFRQAGNFGLLTGLMATAKGFAEVTGGFKGSSVPLAVPAGVLGVLMLDMYNSMFGDDDEMVIPALSAMNQMQDVGTIGKGLALFCLPMFNMTLKPESQDKVIASLARYGGGMLAGRSLESIYKDIDQDMAPLTTMMQSVKSYVPNMVTGISKLTAAHTVKQFKEANDYVNSAYQLTFPIVDNIFGGNNDMLRLLTNSMLGMKSTYLTTAGTEHESKAFANIRNRKLKKLVDDLTGFNALQITNGRKSFNKRVADAEWETMLPGLTQEAYNKNDTDMLELLGSAAQDNLQSTTEGE